jgi:hypothetical protein
MSWVAVGVAGVGAAASVGGSLLSQSGGSGSSNVGPRPVYPLAEIKDLTGKYVKTTQRDIFGTLADTIGPLKTESGEDGKWKVLDKNGNLLFTSKNAGAKGEKQAQNWATKEGKKVAPATPYLQDVKQLGEDLKQGVDAKIADSDTKLSGEEKKLLDNLGGYAEDLRTAQSAEDASLLTDLGALNDELRQGIDLLNEKDKAAFNEELAGFQAKTSEALQTGDTELSGLLSQYKTESGTLGDQFAQTTKNLAADYGAALNQALSLSPERLNQFTQAADFLSQAAVDTRARMLATADPRALELSAIADENAAAMMSGRISADMQANLSRSSAMRALQGGFGAGSQMGRGLAARDLGLTSLDLMRQGTTMYDAQRRLNFDTRVAGLQADAGQLLVNDMTARERQANTLYETGLRTAESERNQRLQALDTVLGGDLARVDTRVGRELGVAGTSFGAQQENRSQATARDANTLTNTWDRNFQTRGGIYNSRMSNERSIYGTNVNAAGNIFSTNANLIGQGLNLGVNTLTNIYGTDSGARTNALNTLSGARARQVATVAQALDNNYASDVAAYNADVAANNANTASNNAMWGSLVNTGMTIAGAAIGTAAGGNTLLGAQVGGAVGNAVTSGSGGGSGGGGGANFLSSLGSAASSLMNRSYGSGTTYNSFAAAQNAAPYTSAFSFNRGMGYTPVAARA